MSIDEDLRLEMKSFCTAGGVEVGKRVWKLLSLLRRQV
jgi:hypothetical protein